MKISNGNYFIGSGKAFNKSAMSVANAMQLELLDYGVHVSQNLVDRIANNDTNTSLDFCTNILKDYTVGKLNPPLFPNWEHRTEFSFSERVFQILGYVFQISGNDLEDPSFMKNLTDKIKFNNEQIKFIDLATDLESKTKFLELARSKVGLNREQIRNLANLVRYFYSDVNLNERIYNDEARISVLLELEKEFGLMVSLKTLKCSPIDALRYSAALLDIDQVKLASDVLYASLTWKHRISLLQFLDSFSYETLFETTGQNREVWTRFYKHIHLFSQKEFINRFPIIGFVARISMGFKEEVIPSKYYKILDMMLEEGVVESTESQNLVYRTFASRVKSAIDDRDFNKISKLMETNSSYLLRNLTVVANGVDNTHVVEFVELVKSKLSKATPNVLFSLLGINVNAKYRIIDIKGNSVVEEANYPSFIKDIQNDTRNELKRRYALPGKVEVNLDLKRSVVPFLSRNTELDRGSTLKVDNSKYLYMFVHWIQNQKRTDLDLSVVSFDREWNSSVLYFGNQVNSYITHSGDIIDAPAPKGATEYIRINLSKIPAGIKYILPIVNVFTGDVFSDNKEVYAGFLFSDSNKFKLSSEHIRYDLTEPANSNIPFLLDVSANDIMILDFNNRLQFGLTAHSEISNMKKLISAANDKVIVTIEMLADILSGEEDIISLKVKKTALKENEIEPNELSKLFNDF